MTHSHQCSCGQEIVTQGWNNNIGSILRCEGCNQKRQALIAEINAALTPESETVYISGELRELLTLNDFTSIEVSYRRPERMNGKTFIVA